MLKIKRYLKKYRYNFNGLILCGLVFFVIGATAFCMVANSREAEKNKKLAQSLINGEPKAAEALSTAVKNAVEQQRAKASSVQPGVPVGTTDPPADEKVVYLTFDDGPSENTKKILDILAEYDAKATFFITGANEQCRPYIKEAYDAGHTIGLHTYTHNYDEVYESDDAYFADLEKVGEVAKEQIGFVPCFIRFPGGSSNMVSAQYNKGIMTRLVKSVQEKGYQYYDWNLDSGDAAGCGKEEIEQNATTDKINHVMILFHDTQTKDATVEALPYILKYYTDLGYEFRGIDRDSYVSHHSVQN